MQQPYSVVQVTDQLNVGGAEQIVVMLANLLQAHGHSSAVVTTVAPGPLAAKLHPAVQLTSLQRGWKWNPVTMYKLIMVLKGFDVVHVHAAYNLRYVYLASRLFFLNKRVFYHEHYGNAVNTIPNALQQYIFAHTCFIAVSNRLAAWAKSVLKLPENNVFVLPNTIVKSGESKPHQPGETWRLCMVGNILPNKNTGFALKLIQALQQKGQPVHLTVIGKNADEKYYQQLSHFINGNNLQQSVAFKTDCDDVQSILHQFDAALHCSFSESGPLVLVEYLAQGLPFVTFNTGEVAEQLQPHLPHFILPGFDIEKWVQAIAHIMTLNRQQTASRFDRLYQQYFSPQTYYQQCIAIYNKGLRCKPSSYQQ